MKIAVTAAGKGLEDQVDWRFGRCRYFVIVDAAGSSVEALENEASAAGGGAGVRAAQMLVERSVDAVVTGQCGPNAFRALQAAGISVYTGADGTVNECVTRFVAGELESVGEPTTESHSGLKKGRSES